MTSFVTLLAALAAITSPLIQAAPVAQAVADPQQAQQRDCAAALVLAQGIKENIEDQKNEKAALAQVDQVLQQTPVDANAFATAKANLLTFVNNGIAIREANQLITPLGNKATEGLAIVANAQLQELNLTQGLTGDPAKDADAIKKLNDGFDGGLKQNQQNMIDAVSGCGQVAAGMMANNTQDANMGNKKDTGKKNDAKNDGKNDGKNNGKNNGKNDGQINAGQNDAGREAGMKNVQQDAGIKEAGNDAGKGKGKGEGKGAEKNADKGNDVAAANTACSG